MWQEFTQDSLYETAAYKIALWISVSVLVCAVVYCAFLDI